MKRWSPRTQNKVRGECFMASKDLVSSEQVKNGLLPTLPMPDGLPDANLTDNARKVLMKRYVRRGMTASLPKRWFVRYTT
jgi:hypothetical protein